MCISGRENISRFSALMPSSGEAVVVAFVLITTAPGKEHQVLEHMRQLQGLSEVHQLFGQFDMIARMETKDYDVLCDVVLGRIRTIPGITGTRTLICANFRR